MGRFNRALLNLLCFGIFFSTIVIMFIFKAGNDLSNIYDRLEKEKQEQIVKTLIHKIVKLLEKLMMVNTYNSSCGMNTTKRTQNTRSPQ